MQAVIDTFYSKLLTHRDNAPRSEQSTASGVGLDINSVVHAVAHKPRDETNLIFLAFYSTSVSALREVPGSISDQYTRLSCTVTPCVHRRSRESGVRLPARELRACCSQCNFL